MCATLGIDSKATADGLRTFAGVKRRLELRGSVDGIEVYDDFAHHPTAVDETLRALRARHPEGALWAVFEARSATACRALHQAAYAQAFAAADRVVLAPLGRAEIAAGERLDLDELAGALTRAGTPAEAATSVEAIVARVAADAVEGDTVALLSNGAFGGIYDKLREALDARTTVPTAVHLGEPA